MKGGSKGTGEKDGLVGWREQAQVLAQGVLLGVDDGGHGDVLLLGLHPDAVPLLFEPLADLVGGQARVPAQALHIARLREGVPLELPEKEVDLCARG